MGASPSLARARLQMLRAEVCVSGGAVFIVMEAKSEYGTGWHSPVDSARGKAHRRKRPSVGGCDEAENGLEQRPCRRIVWVMSTDARLTALRYYRAAGRDCAADLAALAANPQGVVLWSPRLVILMKAADSQHPEQWENLSESPADSDGWYVHLLTGELGLARRLAAEVPRRSWACFQRGLRSTVPHRLCWQRLISPIKKQH